jgi:hypothetical protein
MVKYHLVLTLWGITTVIVRGSDVMGLTTFVGRSSDVMNSPYYSYAILRLRDLEKITPANKHFHVKKGNAECLRHNVHQSVNLITWLRGFYSHVDLMSSYMYLLRNILI